MKTLAVSLCILLSGITQAATYYVDPSSTATTANGSLATPWKTLAQVNSNMSLFQPGDQILFKRGQKFNGTLSITRSGTAGNPIVFGAYGTGADPHFWGTGSVISYLIYMNNRSYITFYGLNISDTTISATDRTTPSNIQRAFYIDGSSTNVLIRKCRLDRVGVGAYIVGPGNQIDSCDIGNMRMVRNTPQSVHPDDDYGANPVVISSASNKITYNYFHDCWATSYDYGYDGGAIEYYGNGASNNYVAYNTFYDCNGVVESGSGNAGLIENNVFAYNKMINNSSLFFISNSGSFVVTVRNMQFYNNVIVENVVGRLNESNMFSLRVSTTQQGVAIMKNNIFWLTNGIDVARSGQFTAGQLVHEDNIYKLGTGSLLNFTAHSSELVTTSNSIFANSSHADPRNWDFNPAAASPAVDFGQTVGFVRDFVGNPVPMAAAPDAGIIEKLPTGSLQASSSVTTAISCNGGTATVTVSATGGIPPYSGTGTFTVPAGTHNYTVTDANGASANTSIIVTQPAALSATVSTGNITVNGGTTTATASATGGTSPYSYRLNNGNFQTSNSFSGVAAGSHSITVRDANNCTFTRNFSISQPAALAATATAGAVACNGGTATVTVSATGGVSPYTGTGTFTVNAGTYSYTVRDANGATTTTSVTVSQPSAISISLNAGTITVNGGTTSIAVNATGGTGAYSYKLNNGSFQTGNTFSSVPAGTHTITVRDANGCTANRSTVITEPAAFVASASAGSIACNGGTTTVTVTATGGTAPYNGTGSFTVNAGTYNYTVTDANGASSTASVTVSQPAVLNATVAAGTININGGTTTATVNAYGGTAPYSYSLNGGNYQSSNAFSNIPAGNHAVQIRDANGCSITKNFSVTQPNVLSASASATNITCNGGNATVTVTASGGLAPYTGTGTFTVAAGTYTYTVTDAGGATATTSITVTQPSAVQASATSGTITVNGGTTTITASASGGTAPYSYRLNTGSYRTSNTFSNVAAGTYTITVRDANGCTGSTSISISQPAVLSASANAASIQCNGGSTTVVVSATGGTAPYTGTGSFSVSAGTYTYTVSDAAGTSVSTSITVTQPAAIGITVSTGSITVFGGTTMVQVDAYGGTGSTYSYKLNNGTFQSSNTFNDVPAGNHVVTVRDANGCTNIKNFTITQPANNPLIASATATSILCNGGTSNVTVTATGGTAPYTGIGTFNVSAGTHNFTVTDANGNSNTASITVTQPAALVMGVNTEVISNGETTTTANIDVVGGTAPYLYSVNGSAYQSSNIFTGITAGQHTASVIDQNGCTVSETFAVSLALSQNLALNLVSKTNVSCRGGNDGMIQVLATGGAAPYSYSINNGRFSTNPLFKNLRAGNYRVTVKDGTSNVASIVVYVFDGRRRCNATGVSGRVVLSAYPNPTTDRFYLTVDSEEETDVQVEVYSIDGKPVYQATGAMDRTFTFGEQFKAGTYIVKVKQGNKVETIRVVKGR